MALEGTKYVASHPIHLAIVSRNSNYGLVGFEFYSAFAAGAFAARVVLLRVRGIESTATSGRGRPGPRLKLFSVPRRYRSKALELVTGFILSARCRITFKYC